MKIYDIKEYKTFIYLILKYRGTIFHRMDEQGNMYVKLPKRITINTETK